MNTQTQKCIYDIKGRCCIKNTTVDELKCNLCDLKAEKANKNLESSDNYYESFKYDFIEI